MKRVISSILCGIMVTGLLAGCGNSAGTTKSTQTGSQKESSTKSESASATESKAGTTTSGKMQTVTIWHDGDESIMNTIETQVNTDLKAKNVEVKFEKKSGLTDQLKLYGNDEANGPDMYFYAHDSLGSFAEMNILAPVTDFISTKDETDMIPMTTEACTYKEKQYMLPVYYETLLFVYNKDLWQGDIPASTDDLLSYMKAHTDEKAGTYALVNQHSTAYNVAPVINGFGGYIIDKNANPGLNTKETKEAITYNQKFAALEGAGDYDTCNTLFNGKKAQAIIGGPWLMSGIKQAGINYGIKSLADFKLPNGNALKPYSGVQGVGVLKYAEKSKKEAITEVLKDLCNEKVGIALAKESNCAPANQKAYSNADVSSNEMIMAMKETTKSAVPMPNIPQTSVMWTPAEALLAAVNKSGEDVNKAADDYQKQAKQAIADMQ